MKTKEPPPRYQTRIEGECRALSDADGELFAVVSLNVSRGGCALDIGDRHLAVGIRVELQLALPPTEKRVALKGNVVWTSPANRTHEGLVVIPAAVGVAYLTGVLPADYLHYLGCCHNARASVDTGYAALFESVNQRWAASEPLAIEDRFELALELAADLITAYAIAEARELLATAIDLALGDQSSISTYTLAAATRLYGDLVTIGRRGEGSATHDLRLHALRRRIRE